MKLAQAVLSILGGGALLGLVYQSTEGHRATEYPRRLRPTLDDPDLYGAIGGSGEGTGSFSVLNPDPENLVWDKEPPEAFPNIQLGWLRVPVHYDPEITRLESPPSACLRVAVKPARVQPARLGPILLHCGGPSSDATCINILGPIMEINSSYVVSPPLSDDYDYWSISQRGMDQNFGGFEDVAENCPFEAKKTEHQAQPWPETVCDGIQGLLQKPGGAQELLKHLDGNPDEETLAKVILPVVSGPVGDLFGVPFYNETYVTWAYRILRLHFRLCISEAKFSIKSPSGRIYNLLKDTGTANLAHDIEAFRNAVGARKMSIYGVSYGTMVGGVYASMFPTKVHRLILDGDMGRHPDMATFANWVGESVENTWAGLARACDESDLDSSGSKRCAAAPGTARKLQGVLQGKDTRKAHSLFQAFQCIYLPGVPCAADLMRCVSELDANTSRKACKKLAASAPTLRSSLAPDMLNSATMLKGAAMSQRRYRWEGILGLELLAQVLGVDYAGHFTEQSFLKWWRGARETQPLGIMRSLPLAAAADAWPVLPRPHPPVGNPLVAPLVIGNLFDPQTPYQNAQSMLEVFPQGRLMTWQGYGHGLQLPANISRVVENYQTEMAAGKLPSYTNEVAKLLCARMALLYLQDGTLPLDYVCKAAALAQTDDVLEL